MTVVNIPNKIETEKATLKHLHLVRKKYGCATLEGILSRFYGSELTLNDKRCQGALSLTSNTTQDLEPATMPELGRGDFNTPGKPQVKATPPGAGDGDSKTPAEMPTLGADDFEGDAKPALPNPIR